MLYTRHTSLLQMKKSFLCILCTAYCNIIMPQIDNNVDNICNTVIMEVVIICMKSSLKKKKRLITVPVSHFHHTIIIFPTTILTITNWAALSHSRTVNSWIATKKKKKKRDQDVLLGLFSLFHHIHALTLLSVWSHISLLVEKYIHMIYKKR